MNTEDNTPVTLALNATEVQSVVNVLAELPTKSNAWPLMQKILQQAQAQMAEAAKPDDGPKTA